MRNSKNPGKPNNTRPSRGAAHFFIRLRWGQSRRLLQRRAGQQQRPDTHDIRSGNNAAVMLIRSVSCFCEDLARCFEGFVPNSIRDSRLKFVPPGVAWRISDLSRTRFGTTLRIWLPSETTLRGLCGSGVMRRCWGINLSGAFEGVRG
jgi:hypothetical protein